MRLAAIYLDIESLRLSSIKARVHVLTVLSTCFVQTPTNFRQIHHPLHRVWYALRRCCTEGFAEICWSRDFDNIHRVSAYRVLGSVVWFGTDEMCAVTAVHVQLYLKTRAWREHENSSHIAWRLLATLQILRAGIVFLQHRYKQIERDNL